ncbi:hypothetical protein K2F54_18620 [Cryobacterium sp. 1639]|uniref:hypothetical protein n=1 Tax=Cryobacterium inferilacus TaxID=2866629 RepID=UPI001C7302A8|nr:hypothetical protein [Cryobacterium sp. 1639]MBX0301979.1 hypothetical protein [Cryobacterium sp. 1639]
MKFRNQTLRWAAISLATSALLLGGAQAASAATVPSPDNPPVSDQFLEENNVEGSVVDVQTDAKGAKFYLYDTGDWVLELPQAANDGGMQTQSYNAGICAGTFVGISRLSNQLYWGGQSSCATTNPTAAYPHSLKIELRKGCVSGICFQNTVRTGVSSDSAYNRVQTVTRFDNCTSAAQYRYDMVARPTVQGVQYGPFVDGDNYVVGCNIS